MKGIGFYDNEFLVIKSGVDLAAESINRIIMTNSRERVGRPGFGADIRDLLFEPFNDEIEQVMRQRIEDQIKTFEPRVVINEIDINSVEDENRLDLAINFSLVDNITDTRILRISFEIDR